MASFILLKWVYTHPYSFLIREDQEHTDRYDGELSFRQSEEEPGQPLTGSQQE